MHALVIENETLTALMIEDALRDAGFVSFDLVCTAREALEAAERRCPDLIVADAGLDAGAGIEVVQLICAEMRSPVIFVAAIADDVRTRMPDTMVMQKPFGSAELMQAAGQAVRENAARGPIVG